MSNRYLVITELFLPTKGGTAVWFDEVYRRLGGKEVHVVTARVPNCEFHDAQHPNTVHRLGLQRTNWLRPESLAMYLKLFFVSFWLACTHRFDWIHAGRVLPEGLVAWAVARLTFRKALIYVHGEELTTWGRGNKYKAMCFALSHADRIVANSSFTHQLLCDMGIDAGKISMIHPGVNLERFRPDLPSGDLRARLTLAPDALLILSVGRLSRRKGFDQVVRALPDLVGKGFDVHYAIVGIGEDEDYLKSLVAEARMEARVHLLGHVSMDELPRWYNACDVFVLANREVNGDNEGFGMVFIEAAACGKAVIAGTAGGTGSAVIDGETGLRIDGDSLPSVTFALETLLGDSEMRRKMGKAAFERARNELGWDSVAAQTLALDGGSQ